MWAALGAALVAGCGPSDTPARSGRLLGAAPTPVEREGRAGEANRPPRVARVALEPERPLPHDRVRVRVEASDPDGDPVRLRYAWSVDGRGVAERGPELGLAGLARGTRVEVSVVASDGAGESEPRTAEATVANQPPRVLRVGIEPEGAGAVPGTLVAVVDVIEPEDDPVELDYEWRAGGRRLEATGPRLATAGLARGQEVTVRVVASDGEERGEPLESAPYALGNRAPEIARAPLGFGADGTLRHTLEARDPDGDRGLRFWLAQAPDGASIDAVLGEILWRPTREQVGDHVIEVVVSDGHGGEARQAYELTVREVSAPPANGDVH